MAVVVSSPALLLFRRWQRWRRLSCSTNSNSRRRKGLQLLAALLALVDAAMRGAALITKNKKKRVSRNDGRDTGIARETRGRPRP